MSVFKTPAGNWAYRVQVKGFPRHEESLGPAATKQDAIEAEARYRAAALDGKIGRAPKKEYSMEDALLKWLNGEASLNKEYENVKGRVKLMKPAWSGKRLDQIASVAQQVIKDGLRDGLSPATINRRLSILRRVANLAYNSWDMLDQPLGKKIKLLPGERSRDLYLTPDEVEQLACACKRPEAATVIRLAVRTGLRLNEILTADTVIDGCIVVRVENSKSNRTRLVPLPIDIPVTLPIPITKSELRHDWEQARAAIGREDIHFHDLRHTCASWWAQHGANLAVIKDLLGHSNLAVTGKYSHLMTGQLKQTAADVEAAIKRAKETAGSKSVAG